MVRNESYGVEADDHTHAVTVTDGVPTACTCKADEFGDGACKHRVAVALAKPVLEAANAVQTNKEEKTRHVALTLGGRLRLIRGPS